MTETLTTLIYRLQELLLDDGSLFDSDTCTAALRQALKHFNISAPRHAGDLIPAVEGQQEYELEEGEALDIIDVLLQGTDEAAERHIPLNFDRYSEDGRLFFRLRAAEAEGSMLIVRYTLPHTLAGLDGADESTLPSLYDGILLDGAAWRACLSRAVGRIETINMNREVPDPWMEAAERFRESFEIGLRYAASRKFARLPDARHWQDAWEGQY